MTTAVSQTQLDFKKELQRRQSQTARLLQMFKLYGELTTIDLQSIGTGCSSQLNTLRKEGHKILAVYEKPGIFRYIYKGQQ